MLLYDGFAISDSEVNVCHMPATREVRTRRSVVGHLRLHHVRNVECLIRDLPEELVRHFLNKRAVACNGGLREAFLKHPTSIIVNDVVISENDGPRGAHPAKSLGY